MNRPNLISLFDSFLQLGAGPAVVQTQGYRRQSRTYAELAAHALIWSHALCARGMGPGDRVLIWGVNSFEWVACFWAVQLRGAVAVPMDAGANPEFVRRTVEQSGAKLILRDRQLPELGCACPTLFLSDLQDVCASPPLPYNAVPDPGDRTTRSSIAEILFTSGTTAEPRGVVLTHGNFLANLEPIERGMQRYLKYERLLHPLRFVSLVPLSHVFGQFMALFVPPLLGATVVFENSTNPAEILRTIKRERATLVIAVPRMLDLLSSAIEREIDRRGWRDWFDGNFAAAAKQSFLRRAWRFRRIHRLLGFRFWAFISGGAALGSETELFFKRLGYAVVQGYGMTETASLISLNHPFSAAEGSVGKILPGREFKLAEDSEILVRGENVSSGYWEKGSLRSSSENAGWLRTGDLGELDANGNLKFRGRKKNVIVTPAGLNIYPEDLEGALKKQSVIREAVVIPLERDGNAEPCAALLLKREIKEADEAEEIRDEDASSAIAGANATLAEYQRMRAWLIWPEPDFPRTATGKPRLAEIATHAAELLSVASSPVPATSSALRKNWLGEYLAAKPLASLSSLDRVELLSALEHRYNVELNESDFSEVKSVGELEKLIEQPAAQANESPRENHYHYPRWTQREPVRYFRLLVYYLLVWPATQVLGHTRIVGRQHLANLEGPVIIVSNHITRRADMGLILATLPARFRHRLATAMGGESLRRMRVPPREWFVAKRWAYQLGYFLVTALFNVFPLPQFSGFRQSFRFAGESADRGYSVLIFPEGEVNNSADGRMAPFRSGIGLLAENLALPIVPMRLDGIWQMKRERRRLAHIGEIAVHIGAPITFPAGTPADEIARQLQIIVSSL